MLTETEKYSRCPVCFELSPIMLDMDTGIPLLSPDSTYMYYCRKCDHSFYRNQPAKQERGKKNAGDIDD